MNRDKQIEKMARDVCPLSEEYLSCEACDAELDIEDDTCIYKCMAKLFASKDYRRADEVEVVRCKDCKHLTVINNESAYARCEKTGYIFWSFRTDTREHFCAYGERKEEE